jgi:proteasome lid subunit RPN8/RPN11
LQARVIAVRSAASLTPANSGASRSRSSEGEPNQVEAACGEILARARLVRVGDWHSHPVRDASPSDADLAAWARHSKDAGVLPYAGVIVTPGEVGWMSPEFHGWITREDDRGLLVCEPGRIDERFG